MKLHTRLFLTLGGGMILSAVAIASIFSHSLWMPVIATAASLIYYFAMDRLMPLRLDQATRADDKRREQLIGSIAVEPPNTRDIAKIVEGILNRPRPEDQQTIDALNQELSTISAKLEEAQSKPIDFFDKLIRITLEYVEAYYKQTQSQAEKAFALCKFAAIVSLAIIAAGITAMFSKLTTQGAVVTAVGAFGEFIAAVFFYLYNQTILKMSEYHQKLVLTQNVSLALKISESLPDGDKAKAQIELIKALSKDINKYLSPVPQTMRGPTMVRRIAER